MVVVPGFIADHADHGVVTLGRGGTDLSAVFFADRLDAHRVRLIKDVDGVYDEDPARNPNAERYSQLSYAEAEKASSGLIQAQGDPRRGRKGRADRGRRARLGRSDHHRPPARRQVAAAAAGAAARRAARLRLGRPAACSTCCSRSRSCSRSIRCSSATPDRHSENVVFTQSLDEALAGDPDVLVELIGGAELAAEAMHSALLRGAQVVTANKAAVAKHWDSLHACAARNGGELRFSAAVGGGAPVIETLRRLDGSVVSVEGVMNGTCNYLLSRLAEGWSFDDALAKAQELGFAEADPSADVDGHDAADKLSILVREAFGVARQPQLIAKHSLRDLVPGAAARSAATRRGAETGRSLPPACPTAASRPRCRSSPCPPRIRLPARANEENRFLVTDARRQGARGLRQGRGQMADGDGGVRGRDGRAARAARPSAGRPADKAMKLRA